MPRAARSEPDPSQIAFIGLGANLGDTRATLRQAIAALGAIGEVVAVSSLWSTAPQLVDDQPEFANAAAALLAPTMTPSALVGGLKEIETTLGRRPGPRYGPRIIDLDLLLVAGSSAVVTDGDVVVPHPRLAERRFVLEPLAELAPDERDPRSGMTIVELLRRVEDQPARVIERGAWWKTSSV